MLSKRATYRPLGSANLQLRPFASVSETKQRILTYIRLLPPRAKLPAAKLHINVRLHEKDRRPRLSINASQHLRHLGAGGGKRGRRCWWSSGSLSSEIKVRFLLRQQSISGTRGQPRPGRNDFDRTGWRWLFHLSGASKRCSTAEHLRQI